MISIVQHIIWYDILLSNTLSSCTVSYIAPPYSRYTSRHIGASEGDAEGEAEGNAEGEVILVL
jgi:hypothetical protein